MNKSLHIVLLSLIAVLLSIFMIVLLVNKDNYIYFNYEEKLIFEEEYDSHNINNLNLKSTSADIIIKKSETDKVKVVVYGNKNSGISSEVKENTLRVDSDNKLKFCIGFCFGSSKVEISLPESRYEEFDIKTVSGDINISSIGINNININTTSGNINLVDAQNGNLYTKSGDIRFSNINTGKIRTISGYIKGNSLNKVEANTISGEIYIKNINNYCEIKTTSGDIIISSLTINNNSQITTVSGNVEINKINDVYIGTSTISGDVRINKNNRYADKELKISTTSGDIEVS